MRKAALVAAMAAFALAQENPESVYEVKYKYEKALKQIRGVQDVSIGGSGNDLRLLVRVETEEAREAVRTLLGDRLQGYKLVLLVSSTGEGAVPTSTGDCSRCACPCHHGGLARPTVVEPRKPEKVEPPRPEELCDILREASRMPKRKESKNEPVCRQMVGWTNDPEKVKWLVNEGIAHWNSKEMPLAGSNKNGVDCSEHGRHFYGTCVAYTYLRHRAACPFGTQSLIEDIERLTPTK